MKRFWTDVTVTQAGHGHGLALDERQVRTPGRAALVVPTRALAEAIAGEWRAVGETIDPRAMPLTGLANAAIDRIAPTKDSFAAPLAAYAETELLCYRAVDPPALVARQAVLWNPLLDWARERFDVHFEITSGIIPVDQPATTLVRMRDAVRVRTAFEIAGLTPVVGISGSLIAGLALIERAIDADTAWAVGNVDEDWQIEHWGDDDIATRTREARRAGFGAGARFIALVNGSARD